MSEPLLLQISARKIAAAVHAREISPLEVLDAHIRRIDEVNPQLNAVVAERFAEARREARAAEADAGREDKPLLGVPFTVKEMIAARGMPLTFGCRNRLGRTAPFDAAVVARLKAAGAIMLGSTNVPEWGMWTESYNDVYGRTNNPHDVSRTPGGSSGGEAAIVAAGGSAFGIGSDIGGSVRMPAAFCGVFAHKATPGLMPLTGHHPVYAEGPDASLPKRAPYVSIGPFARSAGDLSLLLRVMAGDDGFDPNVRDVALQDGAGVDWKGRRVLLLSAPRIRHASAATSLLQERVSWAGSVLESHGAVVDYAPAGLLRQSGRIWAAALQSGGGTAFAELLGAGERVRLSRELGAVLLRRQRYSWPALFFLIAEVFGRRGERSLGRALAELERIAATFDQLLGDDGVLIMPVHPRTAPRHGAAVLRPFDFLYTAGLNALRVPATVVPAGFDSHGLPLAVQVASRQANDHLTLAAAAALEAALPPWRPAQAGHVTH